MSNLPNWLQVLLHVVLNVGTAYVATKYPSYLPLVATVGATLQGVAAQGTYNTVPPPPASK